MGEEYQERIWDGKHASGRGVASGVYVYRLTAGTRKLTKKMALLKQEISNEVKRNPGARIVKAAG